LKEINWNYQNNKNNIWLVIRLAIFGYKIDFFYIKYQFQAIPLFLKFKNSETTKTGITFFLVGFEKKEKVLPNAPKKVRMWNIKYFSEV